MQCARTCVSDVCIFFLSLDFYFFFSFHFLLLLVLFCVCSWPDKNGWRVVLVCQQPKEEEADLLTKVWWSLDCTDASTHFSWSHDGLLWSVNSPRRRRLTCRPRCDGVWTALMPAPTSARLMHLVIYFFWEFLFYINIVKPVFFCLFFFSPSQVIMVIWNY